MFLLIAAAIAAAPLAGATLQHEAEERARADATDLLRTLVRALIGQKLSAAGVPATVQVSQVSFPPRNPPPYVDPQPQTPPEKASEPEQKPELAAAAPTSSRILDKLIDSAPVLAIAI